MRVGVVGVGVAGSSHLFDLVSDDRFEVIAVCARHQERAAQTADLFGVPAAYSDPRLMLEHERLQGLVIAVAPAATTDVLRVALSTDLVTLVEKPAAVLPEQLRLMLARFPGAAERVVVGYNRRYQGHVHEARALLAAAPPSSVATVDCYWSGPFTDRYTEGSTYRRHVGFGDGVLLDTASHILDTLAFLGYQAPTVDRARLIAGPSGADTATELQLSWGEAKTPITINVCDEGPEETWRITIHGSSGRLVLTRTELGGRWLQQDVRVLGDDLRRPVDDLIEIAGGRPAYGANLPDAVAVLETIQQARRAAGSSRRPWKRPRAKALGRLNGAC